MEGRAGVKGWRWERAWQVWETEGRPVLPSVGGGRGHIVQGLIGITETLQWEAIGWFEVGKLTYLQKMGDVGWEDRTSQKFYSLKQILCLLRMRVELMSSKSPSFSLAASFRHWPSAIILFNLLELHQNAVSRPCNLAHSMLKIIYPCLE